MFSRPRLSHVIAYFGDTYEIGQLHQSQSFNERLESEITAHQGQIEAENWLLNNIARFQFLAKKHGISQDDLAGLLRKNKYSIDATKLDLISVFDIPEDAFNEQIDFQPINTADYMRQRAAMLGAVLSSTPVLIRDPWQGKPISTRYGFTDFKAEVDGISFSAIATPRYKRIPFRFAVMKHEHDGYTDNNPAMIMSTEFCDAFADYRNTSEYTDTNHPLIVAMATCLKPNVHDRFHNWFLYDTKAASDVFQQWGNDIYFVEHLDKNPLLINYEQIALCFHLYGYQTMFEKNPSMKDEMYSELENCIAEIESFRAFMLNHGTEKANEVAESTIYAVLTNICFVLNPFEERFQKILEAYPDAKEKLLSVRDDGKGVGKTLERLYGYEDGIPSLKYGGAREAVFEYMLRYPLVDEIRAQLKNERSQGNPDDWQIVDGKRIYTFNLEAYEALPPKLKQQMSFVRDSNIFTKINAAIDSLPNSMREEVISRIEVSEEGYFFFRIHRDEIDYTQLETRSQHKMVLLIDIPQATELRFTNEKKLSIKDKVRKQEFHLRGGKDILAICVRDPEAANEILDYAKTETGHDPARAIEKAKELATIVGVQGAGDMYKIQKSIAASPELYGFNRTGYYETDLEKQLAKSPGPLIMQLNSGGDQRLVKGAIIYLPLGKKPDSDDNPDCHFIENTEFKRDYEDALGTDALQPIRLKQSCSLLRSDGAQEALDSFLTKLHEVNFQITHGANKAEKIARNGGGLFS